jgi:hypothetical protein
VTSTVLPGAEPSALKHLGSWVEATLGRCFQVIDCDDPAALQQWAARWRHRVEMEIVPIVQMRDAVTALEPLLEN